MKKRSFHICTGPFYDPPSTAFHPHSFLALCVCLFFSFLRTHRLLTPSSWGAVSNLPSGAGQLVGIDNRTARSFYYTGAPLPRATGDSTDVFTAIKFLLHTRKSRDSSGRYLIVYRTAEKINPRNLGRCTKSRFFPRHSSGQLWLGGQSCSRIWVNAPGCNYLRQKLLLLPTSVISFPRKFWNLLTELIFPPLRLEENTSGFPNIFIGFTVLSRTAEAFSGIKVCFVSWNWGEKR